MRVFYFWQLKGKTVIISTGTRYRQLGVPGEQQFKNKGVAYCPHCDGPIFKGKVVALLVAVTQL